MSEGTSRGVLSSSGQIAGAMMVMNVATYAFSMLTARVVGPQEYGAFVASLNVLLVIQVVALGLQATAARRIAANPSHAAAVERSILSVTLKVAIGVGALVVLLSPVIDHLLHLDSTLSVLLIAASAVPLTLAGGQMGVLQGERRWAALGVLYVLSGVPRLVVGLSIIWWRPVTEAALAGVALGFLFPVLAGWLVLRGRRAQTHVETEHGVWSIVRESLRNSQLLFAYFSLSSIDIIVARNTLSTHDAGLYAGGLIVTKAMLFLPQFVVVLAFPTMAARGNGLAAALRSMGLVAAIGLVATLATWLLSDLAMVFIGGAAFDEIQSRLWLFAVLGTLLSMTQLLVYAALARQGHRSALLVWAALGALVALGLTADGPAALVVVAICVDVALLVALLILNLALDRARAEPTG